MKIHICFLSRPDWQEWKELAGEKADDSYEEYLTIIENAKSDFEAQGYTVKIIVFDKQGFEKYCRETNTPCNTIEDIIKARSAWAGTK